ncbi:cytochrome bo3 quinol oxidase subunit 2 [Sphingomonas sp. PP-F2F-G114-C0414]|uniref:ubiquinol oxidase subunit II n=1 Tax=Sphingomonas sp. PP-F2F-G114-C0414 TaxID=2135662 RepID=UPI000EF8CDF1|nr:ubiquinol oxidase subunit II [Sphingomonas sp. PP-F2F-G114-C0414]RMB34465.1 cytochrome bo3 quinol oxidase subunit 2 [Sphingomonas sp. PP-F2F-G114-C0414]
MIVEKTVSRAKKWLAVLPLALLTSGCNWVVMSPSGDIAVQQRDLVLIATGLMLLIIVPVIILTLLFAFRYRQANTEAKYEPNWDHSVGLELLIWGIPLLIIIALGALTWTSTHLLDPYRPLGRIKPDAPTLANNVPVGNLVDKQQLANGVGKPLEVQVVALDWKWLFIYPEYGIATVNELAAPVDRPIRFQMTSSSVMNAFYIPALAGMIYTMPGMQTTLNAVINKPGNYEGFSSNYSGAGFSGMRFRFHGVSDAGFQAWVNQVKQRGGGLNRASYLQLEKPSEKVPVRYYNAVEANMFKLVVEQCVQPGKVCMSQMMHGGKGGGDSHAGMAMPGVNGGKGPQDTGHPEGALMKDANEKGSGNHWTAPADIKQDGANSAPGSQSNRNHTMLTPSTMPGTRPVANG